MEFKNHIILIILVLVLIPSVSASVSITDTLHDFEETATKYDDGEISVAQMIVLLEHHHDEKQRKMNEDDFPGWSKTELESALEEYGSSHGNGYAMKTHDMQIFMGIYSDDDERYDWGYNVGARRYPESYYENQLMDDIMSFKESLREAYLSSNPDFKELGVEFIDVLNPIYGLSGQRYDECVELMDSEMDEITDNLPSYVQKGGNYRITPPKDGRKFKTTIYEDSKSECMERCWFDDDCEKICENYPNTISLSAFCSEEGSYLSVTREGFRKDFFNFVQKVSSARQSTPYTKECEPYSYEGNLYFREKLQESLNKEFFDWYVDDFLGNDMEKYLNPTSGFERLMGFFHQTSEQVSNSLDCKGQNEWPDEFEKINIEYNNGNTKFHVWEELRSADHKNVDMWSTLYKYKVIGDKNMMRKIIEYQLSDKSTITPPTNERENIKQDEKAMTVLDKLTSGFGDSLDFKITLKDGEEHVFTRYVKINDEVIFNVSDSQTNAKESELDLTATLTLDDLYDFVNSMTSIDSEKVYGPSWVEPKGPMMIKERIGLIFKIWNSVDVDPWATKLRLSTKIGKILDYMKSMDVRSEEEEKMIAELNAQIDEEGNIKQQ